MDNRVYLKVKVKSLAAEARIIRVEEAKTRTHRAGLAEHRRGIVRHEARHALLAYGFLRGRAYNKLENDPRTNPDWGKVKRMIEKHGLGPWEEGETFQDRAKRKQELLEKFETWKNGGRAP